MRVALLVAAALLCGCAGPGVFEGGTLAVRDVAGWELLGRGEVALVDGGESLRLREGADSGGVVLLSRRALPRDFVLRFAVRPESPDGVNVVLVSVTPTDGEHLELPDDYDGAFAFWNGPDARARSYTFGFHTGFHQPDAFLLRNPGAVEIAVARDRATDEEWVDVEVGRQGRRLWLSLDGQVLLEADDPDVPLPAGRVGLRLRGRGDGSYSSLFRGFSVEALTPEPWAPSLTRQ